jgi:hypothetical protein
MLEFITLGDEERKLVEQSTALNEALLSRLANELTPAGPTPRELQLRRTGRKGYCTRSVALGWPMKDSGCPLRCLFLMRSG